MVLTSDGGRIANTGPRTNKNNNREGGDLMKHTLLLTALLACVVSTPVLAAEPHAKVLTDASANLATANWKVGAAEWGGKNWSVQLRTLHGGRQEGVQVIDVDNGAMTFTIVPTRGFEIWKAQAGKLRLGWDSPVKEIVHPSYIRLTDNGGQGWVAGFGGLVAAAAMGGERIGELGDAVGDGIGGEEGCGHGGTFCDRRENVGVLVNPG